MDRDSSAKTLDRGANSALRNVKGGDSIHEQCPPADPASQKTQGTGTSAFSKNGAMGSMFKADGAIGGTGKVGRPSAKDGAIGWVETLFESHPNIS